MMNINSILSAGLCVPLLKLSAFTLIKYPYNIYVDNGNYLH